MQISHKFSKVKRELLPTPSLATQQELNSKEGIVALDMNFPNSMALPPSTTNILLIVPYSRLLEKMEKGTGRGEGKRQKA